MERVPQIVVVGADEEATQTISLRSRQKGDEGSVELNAFVGRISNEIKERYNYHLDMQIEESGN